MSTQQRALRVLIVDDDKDTADSTALLVRAWGHDAEAIYDGDILTVALSYLPDVIVLDLSVPYMDGCQIATVLHEYAEFSSTMLVAMTGYTDEAHRQMAKDAG